MLGTKDSSRNKFQIPNPAMILPTIEFPEKTVPDSLLEGEISWVNSLG